MKADIKLCTSSFNVTTLPPRHMHVALAYNRLCFYDEAAVSRHRYHVWGSENPHDEHVCDS